MQKEKLSVVVTGLSVVATLISAYVFFTQKDVLNIAGTQWILIGIVLAIYGLVAANCPCCKSDSCCHSEEKK